MALQALYQHIEMRIDSKMKLNKSMDKYNRIFYVKPKTMRNFEDNMAEEDLTWCTIGQCANYSTDLHELLIINYVCFVRMTNTDPHIQAHKHIHIKVS